MDENLAPLIRLEHETSPERAYQILTSRNFIAGPILGDAGLNCYIKGHTSYKGYYVDQAAHKGALIEFEWSGPISHDEYSNVPNIEVLYDQHPHRAFIFVLSKYNLKLSNITLKDGYDFSAVITSKPFRKRLEIFNLSNWRNWCRILIKDFKECQHEALLEEINLMVNEKSKITIIPPRNAIYLDILQKHFPDEFVDLHI